MREVYSYLLIFRYEETLIPRHTAAPWPGCASAGLNVKLCQLLDQWIKETG